MRQSCRATMGIRKWFMMAAVMLTLLFPSYASGISAPNLHKVSRQEIREIILRYMQEKLGKEGGGIKTGDFRYREVPLPGPAYSVTIREREKRKGNGSASLIITFNVDGHRAKKVYVSVPLLVRSDIVRVVSNRKAGEYLDQKDVTVGREWVAYPANNLVETPEEAIGRRLHKNVKKMDILRTEIIESSPAVRKGDMVSIIAGKNGLTLTAKGVVKKGARYGEIARVMNLSSRKTLLARVIDGKTVSVEF